MEPPDCHGVSESLQQRLWDYKQRKEFCDVTLESEGGDQVWAHKVIVASGSRVLHSMLMDPTSVKDEGSGMQILRLPEISAESLRDMVRFLYLGNVERINMETVTLWERFQICDPIRLCETSANLKANPPVVPSPCAEIKSEEEEEESCAIKEAEVEEEEENNVTEEEQGDEEEDKGQKNEFDETEKSLTLSSDVPVDSDSMDQCSERKLEMKCSSPKQRRTRSSNSTKEISESSSEEDEKPSPRKVTKRNISRPKRKRTSQEMGPAKCVSKPKALAVKKVLARTLCKICNIQFDTMVLFKEHKEKMHKNRHTCCECGATFNRTNQLRAHRVDNHYKEGMPQPIWYHCEAEGCLYKTIYKYAVSMHYKSVHAKEKVICETCGAILSRPEALKQHIKRLHGGGDPSYGCDECETSFYSPSLLKAHKERIHNKTLRFLCDQCPFMGFDKISIAMHMFSKHGIPLPGAMSSYSCPHCDYKTPSKRTITAHIERHEQKDYKCELCESVFRCNLDLKNHRRLRHSKSPRIIHQCPYEGCKYASKYGPATLKNHISRIHENKDFKPWACQECDYRTNVKGNLNLHLRKVHGLNPKIHQHRVSKLSSGGATSVPEPPSGDAALPANPIQQNFHGYYPEMYHQGAPQPARAADDIYPPLPVPSVPIMHSAQYGLVAPPGGDAENLFIAGLQ